MREAGTAPARFPHASLLLHPPATRCSASSAGGGADTSAARQQLAHWRMQVGITAIAPHDTSTYQQSTKTEHKIPAQTIPHGSCALAGTLRTGRNSLTPRWQELMIFDDSTASLSVYIGPAHCRDRSDTLEQHVDGESIPAMRVRFEGLRELAAANIGRLG